MWLNLILFGLMIGIIAFGLIIVFMKAIVKAVTPTCQDCELKAIESESDEYREAYWMCPNCGKELE